MLAAAGFAVLSLGLAGCSGSSPKVALKGSKEYFAESEYGVKASPRVAYGSSSMPRGGGRYQVGKAYQIKGRWYQPQEDPDYVAEGAASWYGDAFHGRLTANGEVYDMTHLTAAHPTMPLPSYARVTNLSNGNSVVVRVNDRGPFSKGRIIDLSRRAAEMLDYKHMGVARVRVEYVGPAPLHGRDDGFLLASYRPGGAAPDPSDGLPTGVMVAMAGPTPTQPVPVAASAFASQPGLSEEGESAVLPATGPIVPDRPTGRPAPQAELAALSYAQKPVGAASRMFDAVVPGGDGQTPIATDRPFVNLGAWSSRREVERLTRSLSALGQLAVERREGPAGPLYVLSLVPDGRAEIDQVLRSAWAAGAVDAFIVRD
ncbi:septal ring lytic transglycosylase RlpA family protein [Chelativorans sp.]|uniref:septal ring lytic transglycosylase RlpA family protein n=1 Tax=Chelativorans sp. TaxID=2203393 RepID=UPI0035C77A8C